MSEEDERKKQGKKIIFGGGKFGEEEIEERCGSEMNEEVGKMVNKGVNTSYLGIENERDSEHGAIVGGAGLGGMKDLGDEAFRNEREIF